MKYRRIVVRRYGGPEVLEIEEVEARNPVAGECRIRVKAAGIARSDIMMRRGIYPVSLPPCPFTPGREIAGVVDLVGEGVTGITNNDSVIAFMHHGGYSETVYLQAAELVSIPPTIDFVEAASLPMNYTTAYQMFHRCAELRPGKRILVHSAGSGVGSALLQLGTLAGVEIIGTASIGKHELLARLGATPLDYRTQDFVSFVNSLPDPGVDVVFDPIGGSHIWRSFRTLRPGGKVIVYGEQAYAGGQKTNRTEEFVHRFLLRWLNVWPNKKVMFYELDPNHASFDHNAHLQDLRALVELLKDDQIKPVIAASFSLEDARHAHQLFDAGGIAGKLVLTNGE